MLDGWLELPGSSLTFFMYSYYHILERAVGELGICTTLLAVASRISSSGITKTARGGTAQPDDTSNLSSTREAASVENCLPEFCSIGFQTHGTTSQTMRITKHREHNNYRRCFAQISGLGGSAFRGGYLVVALGDTRMAMQIAAPKEL